MTHQIGGNADKLKRSSGSTLSATGGSNQFVNQHLTIFKRALDEVFGKTPYQIALSVSATATGYVFKKIISFVIISLVLFVAYVLIFRLMVAPLLIEDATHFNAVQAVLFPVFYSVDYFLVAN